MTIKIVHLHTDPKFIGASGVFEGDSFENRILFISDGMLPDHSSAIPLTHLPETRRAVDQAVTLCGKSDAVILYGLDGLKSFIANRLPPHVKVGWRFFGYELYGRLKSRMLGEATRKTVKLQRPSNAAWLMRKAARRLVFYMKMRFRIEKEFRDALKRTNFFLGLFEDEYEALKRHWPDLPRFIRLPIRGSGILAPEVPVSEKSRMILLGNSRNVYNNHLEMIERIDRTPNTGNYEFVLLFNYGKENLYTRKLRKRLAGRPGFRFFEHFLPKDDFVQLLSRASSLVINGFRPMALGTIFPAIETGVKIYLNEKNIALYWLRREGFHVFTTERFFHDLKAGDLALTESETRGNQEKLGVLKKIYSAGMFRKTIRDEILT